MRTLSAVWIRLLSTAALLVGGGLLPPTGLHAASKTPWLGNRVSGSPNPPAPYTTERAFPKLRFQNPVDLALVPGTGRFMVAEQGGKLWTFDTTAGAAVETRDLALDIRSFHPKFAELLGFAFHPGFATNRFVFLNYNEPQGPPDGARIVRFTVASLNPPVLDPSTEKVILTWPSGGHNGCTLAFGNDGTLFISTGDGASPEPPDGLHKTGQDIGDLMASILRIDVDHPSGDRAYSIPADNPFVRTPGARGEVWAFGLRNPFRMSVDPATGDVWIGDVGWEQWEMIYRGKPGANFGWPLTEGPNPQVRTDLPAGPGPIIPPVVALPHSEAASITGGRVYHGRQLGKLRGAYIYGDWETGKFWALRHDNDRLTSNEELCDTTLKPVAFAEDADHELLVLDYNGGLHRFVPNLAPAANLAFPKRLSDTGLFADLPRHTPAPGVVAYRPNASQWSDHALVDRLIGIPGNRSIVTADGRETIAGRMWNFPSNTVFTRTLTLELDRGQPLSRRRIETQMMHFDGQTWNAYTYRWNASQTDADLVPAEGASEAFTIKDPSAPGGQREVPWRFLGRTECFRCHNVWAGDLLSFQWPQLGHPSAPSEAARLEALGVLQSRNAPPADKLASLVDPYDSEQPLDRRARSWLDVNCSGCHRFGAGGGVTLYLHLDRPLAETRAIDQKPARGSFGMIGGRIIASGDPHRSLLFHRINTEGSARMPHIGSRVVDPAGARLIGDWIRSLPAAESGEPDVQSGRALAEEIRSTLRAATSDPTEPLVQRLLGNLNGALALLDTLGNRPFEGPEAVRRHLLNLTSSLASNHTNGIVRDLFQRLLPPGQRRQTLGADIKHSTILSLQGDPARGQDLFGGVAQCANCHVRDGVGRAFGPDLTAIATKYQRDQILEHILHPSQLIAPEFKTVTVTRKDESEISGFVVRRTPSGLVLKDALLVEHDIPISDIQEQRESSLSAMPEGLLAGLTAQEAADVLDYLVRGGPRPGTPRAENR